MRDEAVAISDSLCCAGADLLSSEMVRSCKVVLAVALMLLTSGAKLINTAEEKCLRHVQRKSSKYLRSLTVVGGIATSSPY